MPAKKNPNAKKKHTNYRPFIRYIEHHAGLVDPTVAYTNRKFNSVQKNIDSNYVDDDDNNKNTNKNMPSTAVMDPNESPKTFASQTSSALGKKEKDDARHADLHENVKTKDYEDKDKIFLLKREIDQLQSKIRDQKDGGTLNGPPEQASLFTNIPMLTGFLLFGVALVASRFFARKLRLQRVTNSLLMDEVGSGGGGGRSYEYQPNEGIVGFELQDQQAGQPSGGLFSAIASTLERNKANQTTPQQTHGGASYMAPSEQQDTTIQFV